MHRGYKVIDSVQALGKRPLIRISSTFFWHLSSDFVLEPIPDLRKAAQDLTEQTEGSDAEMTKYERMKVGMQVQKYARALLSRDDVS